MTPAAGSDLRRLRALGCLLALAVLHIGLSAWWMHSNGFFSSRPPYQDAAFWRVDSLRMMQGFERDGFGGWLEAGLLHNRPHPPLLPMLAALTSLPEREVSVESQWRVEMIFLGLLPFIAYRLARNFGSRKFAVFAAAAMTSAPVLLVSARVFYPKFPMTVITLAALDALLRSQAFTRVWWSITFGALAGLNLLTFMLAPIYVIGSAACALGLGLARVPPRRSVIVNACLAVLVMLLVAATWYTLHWRATLAYASDVTSSLGQQRFSGGLELWTLERWLFYPLALVNNGLGFLLSVWVAAAALGGLVVAVRSFRPRTDGPRGEPRFAPGWTLCAGAIVSLLIIVPGQVAGFSEYVMHLAPLALLFAAYVIKSIRTPRMRVTLATLFGLTCAFTVFVAYRPLYGDEIRGELGPLRVFEKYDPYGGSVASVLCTNKDPRGEVWPIEKFVDLMIPRSPSAEIRLGELQYPYLHHYLNTGNLAYAALKHGIGLRSAPVPRPDAIDQADLRRLAFSVDFMVVDPRYGAHIDWVGDYRRFLDEIRKQGVEVEVLAHEQVTPCSEAELIHFVRPYERPALVEKSVLDESTVRKVDVEFANGWRLLGVEVRYLSPKEAVVNTFWDPERPGKSGFEMFVQVGDATKTVGTGACVLAAPWVGSLKGKLAVCTARVDISDPDPSFHVRVGTRLLGRGQLLEDHSPHVRRNVPDFGQFMVIVAL